MKLQEAAQQPLTREASSLGLSRTKVSGGSSLRSTLARRWGLAASVKLKLRVLNLVLYSFPLLPARREMHTVVIMLITLPLSKCPISQLFES